jgi:hypothetical protein
MKASFSAYLLVSAAITSTWAHDGALWVYDFSVGVGISAGMVVGWTIFAVPAGLLLQRASGTRRQERQAALAAVAL